jgi:hypothetical protein
MTWTYDVLDPTTGSGPDDGTMTLVGQGELTQIQMNAAVDAYYNINTLPLITLFIGPDFTSLGVSAVSSTSLKSIVFDSQSKVTTIHRKGLSTNLVLTNLVLPRGLVHLSEGLCAGCVSLTTITIPTNVKTIGYRAFHGCSLLDSFSLPNKVTTIVDNAFENCKALKTTDFAPVNSELVILGDASFKDCVSLDTMILPESLLGLGDSTFMGCVELANITLPALLESMGQETFRGCTALRTVVFPESLQSIVRRGTFLEATGVRTLRMHRDIVNIVAATLPIAEERQLVTFYQDLDYVYSPKTLAIQRDQWAYDQVQGVVSRVYDGTLTLLGPGELTQSQVNAAIDEHTHQHGMNQILHTLLVGEYIESLGPSAISSTSLKSIVFDSQSNVTKIHRKGLSTNLTLTNLILPPGLVHLSEGLCAGCVSLTTITIPTNVKTIGYRAFHDCSLLHTFVLPTKVTTIVDHAFENCKALRTTDFAPVNSELVILGDASFKDCVSLDTMILPESLLVLGDSTFMGCVELTDITLPALLQSMGQETFRGCTALRTIVFPESLQSIVGRGTFLEATGVRTLRMHRDIKDIVVATLPIAVERQLVTFYQDLDYIYLPKTLAIQRDPWAYDQVQGKTEGSRVYDGTMTLLGPGELTQSQVNAAIDEHTYQHGMSKILHTLLVGQYIESLGPSAISSTSLKSIVFHPQSNVTRIYRKGLSTNLVLTNLVLPSGLNHISESMCANCISLVTITIPANVKTIGYRAFHNCVRLETFSLPAKVTNIVNSAFENCKALRTTNFAPVNSELVTLGDSVFKDCFSLETIVFPESLATIGDFLFQGATSISSVTLNQSLWTDTLLPPHKNGFPQTVSYSNDPTVVYSVQNGGVLIVSTGLVYDVLTSTMLGTYDGRPLRVVGSGELTQSQLALVLGAFAANNGSRLFTINLDKSFAALGVGAFANVTTLSSILFPADSELVTIGQGAFQGCTALEQITIPATVTTIGDLAFDNSNLLKTVDFAPLSQLTSLGNTVFKDCTSLRTVQFPQSLLSLQDSTFLGCTALKDVGFSTGLRSLGKKTYHGCTDLTTMIFPDSLTSLGTATFQNCTSLQNVVFPRNNLLTIEGTTTFAGATAIQTLQMHESLWDTAIQASIVKNVHVLSQLVQFYGDPDILQSLETQRILWNTIDGLGGANAEGYQHIVDYYSTNDNYMIDYSGGITTLVKSGGTTGLIYDVSTNILSGLGTYDGALTIVGSVGELTQTFVNTAIAAHIGAQNGVVPLRTLTVGPTFTSLGTSLSLQGTGITKLMFPAESPITTTGVFGLAIDSTLVKTVVLPRWVVQQGPWSV